MNFDQYCRLATQWLRYSGIKILVILVLALVAIKVAGWLSGRLLKGMNEGLDNAEFRKRADTLGSVVQHVLNAAIIATAGMMILAELGLRIAPVLAAAGVIGLAVGFGAQSLVKDVISGFFILLEDQIRVGDTVEIAGKSGLVERVNLRMIVIRDGLGNVHYVPSGEIGVVTNMTREYSQYIFEIGVGYGEDYDEVVEVIKQVDADLQDDAKFSGDILEPLDIWGLDKFADSAVIIKARIRTKPSRQWGVAREFNRRLKIAFDEKGIEMPYPHITLTMGSEEQGNATSLNVSHREGE